MIWIGRYLVIGLLVTLAIFGWELFKFRKEGKENRSPLHTLLFKMLIVTLFWPWLLPFYVYENK